ncbi:MAG: hypothetical protein LBF71_00425 [Campylobacteraceae bacterium]|jgi:uncharacterized membrane protein|nr:hypothetical protein [Campylobacteraceae bacterium]
MRFLLVNTNPAVSKLINASLNRIGLETEEIKNYNDLPLDSFIAVIVDSDSYDASHVDDLLAVSIAPSLIYLKQQNTPTPSGFQYALAKPFLPTDFITFIVSILKKNPELERFITQKADEFVSMLPEEGRVEAKEEDAQTLASEEQAMENNFINFNFYDDLQKKEPIFSAQEPIESAFGAPKIEPDKTDDVFFNLSEDVGKLYSLGDDETIIEKSAEEEETTALNQTQTAANDDENIANIQKDISNGGDFTLSDSEKSASKTESGDIKLDIPAWTQQDESDDKVNFDFNIMDKVEQTKPQEEFSDNFLKEPTIEEPKNIGGFEELAKEFDDLIQTPNKEIPKDTKLPSYADERKDSFENLNEKEMKRALQDGGLLPQSAAEMVKSEIQNVVQDSVHGMLQGHILRDILKGLKMNITITFEDK